MIEIRVNRQIKHRVHADANVVCCFQREEAFSRVCQQSQYFFEVFDCFCYNY